MIPLKKIFPVIVVLITLSLLGIIYIQVSWIRNAIAIKKEQLNEQSTKMAGDVQKEMVTTRQSYTMFRLRKNQETAKNFGLDIKGESYVPPMSAVYDNPQKLRKLIQDKMGKNHLDPNHFEFAILGPIQGIGSQLRVHSANFETAYRENMEDSASERKRYHIIHVILDDLNNFGPDTETLMIITPVADDSITRQLGIMITGSILFTIIIITAFALTVRTLLNQKKLSEIKSDFINNMTHELKTPLATISLAIDAIGNEKVMSNADKIRYFSGIIKEENKRMNKQVESILQSALLEKDEIGLKLQAMDVHQVIRNTTDNLQLQLAGKNGVVDLQLDAINPVIMADDVHFSNVVFNLLDNAIKYSKEDLEIKIQTYNTRKSLFIIITDNGIGMSRDTISRIFEKFYRAHTGNVHNVKGFGLGLTYVKAIVDAHKGKIKVESTLGKGSKFTLEFPQE
ncbi:sensor histidine kinase [Chitinophaga qingshengii]|uniref:histidine kinase n=1 Tax=Chitinophaga qingshengii TaxID=1569794 RepID=A0ABR7TMW8_9BACT|nr:HAMP domain-containing sensor histidine kinase [Chitinophaga qingshengii]MBC9930851.1 HAMP domain-containing histidine kinase [Chitinophaga qingshengii]